MVAHLELHSPICSCLLPLLFNIIRGFRLIHPRWVGSSIASLLLLQLVQRHRGPVGRKPHLYVQIPPSQSQNSVSWVAEGVQRHGPNHCWVDSFLLLLSHCIGTMSEAVPEKWVVSSSLNITDAPCSHHRAFWCHVSR